MVVDQVVRAEDAAVLLVGEERDHEVAGRPLPAASSMSPSAVRIIASMSFMSTAPRPQSMPSRISPANGSTLQFAAIGRDDVEVAVQHERRAGSGRRPATRATTLGAAGLRLEQSAGSRPSDRSSAAT